MSATHPLAASASRAEKLIPKESYLSHEFVQLEKEHLWPKVWLMACREEDVQKSGSYMTFDIADESILVVRDQNLRLGAFYNVCQHRGRRLAQSRGTANKFTCRYHGWRWNIDGSNDVIVDQEDWGGELCNHDVDLKRLKVDSWGGWVFVSMNPDVEPLQDYLKPFVHAFRNYRFEDLRMRWSRTVILPCNWKAALDVFIEGYHAQTAHRQTNAASGDNRYYCKVHGPHSMFYFREPPVLGDPSKNLAIVGSFAEDTARFEAAKSRNEKIYQYFDILHKDIDALITERKVRAVRRLVDEMPPETSFMDAMITLDRLHREEGRKDGVNWDHLSMEDVYNLGMDWHMFPNVAILAAEDAALIYRARPNGDDPDTCIYDMWSLERFAPGREPKVKNESFKDWRETQWPRVFVQDFENLADLQLGMKSRGFAGGRGNPVSELTVINFHKHVRQYCLGEQA